MEADASQGVRDAAPSPLDSIRELVVFFIRYVELRLQLRGLESRETAFHMLAVLLLLVSVVVCFGCFVIMLVIFLFYLMMLTLHWEWGWSALALAAVLLVQFWSIKIIYGNGRAAPQFSIEGKKWQT